MIKASLKLTGLEEYMKKISDSGKNIEPAVVEAIHESTVPVGTDILNWLAKHELTGASLEGFKADAPKVDGNIISSEIGVSGDGVSWHATFVEYGTPKMAADPGIRPAFANNKAKVKAIQRKVLKAKGVPVD